MQAFASFILRGRIQAILIAASSAVIAMILPPLTHISGAAVALVTLRKGFNNGLVVIAGAAVAMAVVGLFSSLESSLLMFLLATMVLVWWLPTAVAAKALSISRSLGYTLTVVSIMGCIALLLVYMLIGDVSTWWHDTLSTRLMKVFDESQVQFEQAEIDLMLDSLVGLMTGFMVATMVVSIMINLFIARWMQAMLFNPGGFRKEFNQLRMGRNMGLVALVAVFAHNFLSGWIANFSSDLLILLVVIYCLPGLAFIYAISAAKGVRIDRYLNYYLLTILVLPILVLLMTALGMPSGWLLGIYMILASILPVIMFVLSLLGFADSWLDFRSRFNVNDGQEV